MKPKLTFRAYRLFQVVALVLLSAVLTLAIAEQRYQHQVNNEGQNLTTVELLTRDRPVTTLSNHTIQPITSADGVVAQSGTEMVLRAPILRADIAYRFVTDPPYAIKALIEGGPAGFNCEWKDLVPSENGEMAIECLIPDEVPVVPGLTGTMVISLSAPVSGPALPLSAVFGEAGSGTVVVIHDDGSRELRTVALGVSDNRWIAVSDGLEESAQVLVYPVEADLADTE